MLGTMVTLMKSEPCMTMAICSVPPPKLKNESSMESSTHIQTHRTRLTYMHAKLHALLDCDMLRDG